MLELRAGQVGNFQVCCKTVQLINRPKREANQVRSKGLGRGFKDSGAGRYQPFSCFRCQVAAGQ